MTLISYHPNGIMSIGLLHKRLGMAMGWVRVGWINNPTHDESDSGKKSDPHTHLWVKFQTRTRRVLGARRVLVVFVNGLGQCNIA
jgi:hypothetical protein